MSQHPTGKRVGNLRPLGLAQWLVKQPLAKVERLVLRARCVEYGLGGRKLGHRIFGSHHDVKRGRERRSTGERATLGELRFAEPAHRSLRERERVFVDSARPHGIVREVPSVKAHREGKTWREHRGDLAGKPLRRGYAQRSTEIGRAQEEAPPGAGLRKHERRGDETAETMPE